MENEVKNILYVTTRLPWPLIGGDRVNIYNYLKELKNKGHKITLVTLVSDDDDLIGALDHSEFYTKLVPVKFNKKFAYLNAVKAIFSDRPFIVEYFYNRQMQKVIDDELATRQYDLVIGYIIRSLPYIQKHKNIKRIVHLCDAISMMYERRLKEKPSLFDRFKIGIEYIKVKNYEKKACITSDKQVLISEIDKKYLAKFANVSNVEVIGFATDTDYYSPIYCKKENNICFVGSMQYIPNSEAAIYFATKIFPMIKKEIPDVKFKIIGANPRKELFEATKNIEGIQITGRVEDVREYMKDCKVSVCPVKIAGGIQAKILEAMSMGIPVVTTPEGAEGINADSDLLLVAYSDNEYAKKVIEFITNDKLRKDVSSKARDFIIHNFSWKTVGKNWNKLIYEVCVEK
ncbi:glycosyltransferase [bacterium]|nr:glycosyltransferase [bacterium]